MPTPQEIIEELLHQGTPVTFQAQGPSMNPTIRTGESVRIRSLQTFDIQRGTVILYKINGRLGLHRCIINAKQTNQIWVVGDAALTGGDWISQEDLLGIAVLVHRNGRTHRLDTWCSRLAGRIRYAFRPVRRLVGAIKSKAHPHTSTPLS